METYNLVLNALSIFNPTTQMNCTLICIHASSMRDSHHLQALPPEPLSRKLGHKIWDITCVVLTNSQGVKFSCKEPTTGRQKSEHVALQLTFPHMGEYKMVPHHSSGPMASPNFVLESRISFIQSTGLLAAKTAALLSAARCNPVRKPSSVDEERRGGGTPSAQRDG